MTDNDVEDDDILFNAVLLYVNQIFIRNVCLQSCHDLLVSHFLNTFFFSVSRRCCPLSADPQH